MVAGFTEAGTNMMENEKKDADQLFEGSCFIFNNSTVMAHAPQLLECLKELMADYNQTYQDSTDGEHGKTPATPAWRRAQRLVRKLQDK